MMCRRYLMLIPVFIELSHGQAIPDFFIGKETIMKLKDFLNDDVDLNQNVVKPKIRLITVSDLAGAQQVADYAKKDAVIVKIKADKRMDILNIRQFLSGASYMSNAKMGNLDENTVLLAPAGFDFVEIAPKKADLAKTNETKEDTKKTLLEDVKQKNIDIKP